MVAATQDYTHFHVRIFFRFFFRFSERSKDYAVTRRNLSPRLCADGNWNACEKSITFLLPSVFLARFLPVTRTRLWEEASPFLPFPLLLKIITFGVMRRNEREEHFQARIVPEITDKMQHQNAARYLSIPFTKHTFCRSFTCFNLSKNLLINWGKIFEIKNYRLSKIRNRT